MEDEDENPLTFPVVAVIVFLFLFLPLVVYADDTDIMTSLSQSLKPTPPGWTGSNPCKWTGIVCDSSGRVTSIDLESKSLSGTLPTNLQQLSGLQSISLQRNRLTGAIPSLADMPDLREVYLDENFFSSVGSPFLEKLPSLQFFSIEDNPLRNWQIPEGLSSSSSLVEFHAANSSVNGTIPDIFDSLTSLKDLRLSYNDLTGSLPLSISQAFLENLWINNQKQGLSGGILGLGQITSLKQLWLHANSFSGPIPDFSKCTTLFDLQLRDNHFTGVIPPSLSNLPSLVNISLQNNKFQGPMPSFGNNVKVTLGNTNSFCLSKPGPCDPQVMVLLEIVSAFGYPSVITDSWVGNDACANWAHVTCNSVKVVILVNFGKLGWVGPISPAFANLTSLNSILLNDNKLYGTIPDALTTLKLLQKLDLSNNNLTGKVPAFDKNVVVVLDGNPFIGTNVDTSLNSTQGVVNSDAGTSMNQSSENLSSSVIAGIVFGFVVLLIALGLFMYKFVLKKDGKIKMSKKRKSSKVEALKMSPLEFPLGSPTEASSMLNNIHTFFDHGTLIPIQVLRDVTDHFSDKNILGRGGFGVVYKGVLQDGTQIAVKRMEGNLQGTKGMSEFEAEIAVLSKVRHRHLVALLGYCVTKDEKIVVYEYMPQGTLGQHLFECDKKGFSPLTWKQRLVIALDVARGVEYLHSLAQQSFIHRDLKPSNILLGDQMRAKVSDFGLVKSAPDQGKYSVETRLAGTFGYLAPEYAATGRVTTKVDVFAFGVVLMELITGRKALDESLPEDETQLVSWFRRVVIQGKENIRKSLDPNLETDDEELFDSICQVAELSGHCTTREPNQRPDMSHAVSILSPLVNQWRPTEVDAYANDDDETELSLPDVLQRWKDGDTTYMTEYSVSDSTPTIDKSLQGR